MNYFDLRKFLAEGGIKAKLKENFFEEELQNEGEDKAVEKVAKLFLEEGDEEDEMDSPDYEDTYGANVYPFVTDKEERAARKMHKLGLEEMARTSNTFSLKKDANVSDVRSFMTKVNNLLKTYKSPGQKKPKSRFTDADMDRLADVLKKENFTSKDILDAISEYDNNYRLIESQLEAVHSRTIEVLAAERPIFYHKAWINNGTKVEVDTNIVRSIFAKNGTSLFSKNFEDLITLDNTEQAHSGYTYRYNQMCLSQKERAISLLNLISKVL